MSQAVTHTMTSQTEAIWTTPVAAQDVADSRSASRWTMRETGWEALSPQLSDDVAALLAPPVVVTAR